MIRCVSCLVMLLLPLLQQAQISPGVYKSLETLENGTRNYLLIVTDSYIVHTVYDSNPANFVSTLGGVYRMEEDSLKVTLEFNSDFEKTEKRIHHAAIGFTDGNLIFNGNESRPYSRESMLEQALDGFWLFAARGPDTGQDRRGDDQPRKTLKFLIDGYFQWTAYNTETMDFRGCGGGRYAAENGTYTEVIQFFSRDDSRVGAELNFQFERKGNDWHHRGKNSRGEPMYEIWSLRK